MTSATALSLPITLILQLLSQPQFFQQQHIHTDVRLALGYLSVLVAGATGLYGWKVEFEKSKMLVRIGVVMYVHQTLRRGHELTLTLQLFCSDCSANDLYCILAKGCGISRKAKDVRAAGVYSWTGMQANRVADSLQIETERLTVSSKTLPSSTTTPPQYSLELEYLHSANGGKAVLKHGRQLGSRGYNTFFDAQGNMLLEVFDRWVESLVSETIGS
jgi:signal peptidase complex subunit 2